MKKLSIILTLVCIIFTVFSTSIYATTENDTLSIYSENSNIEKEEVSEKIDKEKISEEIDKEKIEFNKENFLSNLENIKKSENTEKIPMQNTAYRSGRLAEQLNVPEVTYQAHVQDVGWMNEVTSGGVVGQAGSGRRLEAVKISASNLPEGANIKYRAHVQDIGWQAYSKNGEITGTSGRGLRIEALQIYLENANEYSVKYRTYVQGSGWQSWCSDNAISGTVGKGLRIEAVQIRIVEKLPTIKYSTHVQNIGWQPFVKGPQMAGTEGMSYRLEGIKIYGEDLPEGASIKYRTHVQDIGWQDWVRDGQLSGTSGRSLRLEAIQIELENAPDFYIEYRTHVQNVGWQNWVGNGQVSGTSGMSLRLEGIEIRLYRKPTKFKVQIDAPEYANISDETFEISGDVLSTTEGSTYKVYVDDKEVTVLNKTEKPELFETIKDYGTEVENPTPHFTAKLNTGAFSSGKHTIRVVVKSKYSETSYTETREIVIVGSNVAYGIDVSTFQGNIDWQAVKNAGIEFAMIRVGFRGAVNPVILEDKQFKKNISEATRVGIKCGVYFFTQAVNEAEAIEEARYSLEKIKGYNITYPVAIDTESIGGSDWVGRGNTISVDQRTAVVKAFCDTVKNAGYKTLIYANKQWLENSLNMNALNNYGVWMAHYTPDGLNTPSSYKGPYSMWQYTSSGSVTGIIGSVDMNIEYK